MSSRCTRVKGHGGAQAALRAVQAHLKGSAFVMRTDVNGYYDSIDQHRMLEMIRRHIKGNRGQTLIMFQRM